MSHNNQIQIQNMSITYYWHFRVWVDVVGVVKGEEIGEENKTNRKGRLGKLGYYLFVVSFHHGSPGSHIVCPFFPALLVALAFVIYLFQPRKV